MNRRPVALVLALAVSFASPLLAAGDGGAGRRLPVREVTVFKDGHAFVLQEGKLPVSPEGEVTLNHLPAPVMGTFWPYSAERGAPLKSVVAGERRVQVTRTPLSLAEFVEANAGADILVNEKAVASDKGGASYEATLLGIPQRSASEVEESLPPGSGLRLPEKGSVVLLTTSEGTKVLPLDRILDLTLRGQPKERILGEELRNCLTLKLDFGGAPSPEAVVGLAYLQRGLRWIPSYRVELDGKGEAKVKLQATLVNDLTDLEDVTAHLVIGVPSFAFAGEVDPMALQKEAARLGGRLGSGYATANAFSNAIMTQTANTGMLASNEEQAASGPEVKGGERAEDLFIFTVRGLTLRKGERAVLPVQEATFRYKDVYTLEIPAVPPPEMSGQRNAGGREVELARMLAAPKVIHKVRWTNTGKEPLTTAPALILSGGRPLAQGLMTYAAPGATEELEITAAVDVPVMKNEAEVRRVPDAVVWNGNAYTQVFLKGTVTLTNRRGEPVEIEVTRRLLGVPDTASHGGAVKKLNPMAEPEAGLPGWWYWYSWPYWWSHFNGLGTCSWKLNLEPGKSAELEYSWHYYWR